MLIISIVASRVKVQQTRLDQLKLPDVFDNACLLSLKRRQSGLNILDWLILADRDRLLFYFQPPPELKFECEWGQVEEGVLCTYYMCMLSLHHNHKRWPKHRRETSLAENGPIKLTISIRVIACEWGESIEREKDVYKINCRHFSGYAKIHVDAQGKYIVMG